MANSTVNDFSSLIKHQIQSQECIFEHLKKIEVLLDHALESDLLHKSPDYTQYYFWAVWDLATKAVKISENAVNGLARHQSVQFSVVS